MGEGGGAVAAGMVAPRARSRRPKQLSLFGWWRRRKWRSVHVFTTVILLGQPRIVALYCSIVL